MLLLDVVWLAVVRVSWGAVNRCAFSCGAVNCDTISCGAVSCGAVSCGAVSCGAVCCGEICCGSKRERTEVKEIGTKTAI